MKQLSRYGGAALAVVLFWIVAAALQTPNLFFVGPFVAWLWLWLTNGSTHLPTLYWERLLEPKILMFLSILGVTHAVPGYVVFSAFPSYLWIFLTIAIAHISLEILIICLRNPYAKKPISTKISVQKARKKWIS